MHPAPLPGRVLAWTVLAFLVLPATARAQGEILPQGFELQPVITDVFEPGRPVGFAELPDGRFLVIERNTGFVRLHAVGSAVAPVIHTVPDVSIEAERGLLGIAIDPGWPARPYVYVYYTYFTKATGNLGRLRLYTATGDLADPLSSTLALGNPFDLLTDLPDDSEIHNGGTLRFGPDGMLYLSLGDDGDACNAQDLTTLAGGILRLDVSGMPEVGPGPPDKADLVAAGNPFPGPDPNERLFWTWGLRNPFRFTIDPATGDLQIGDVGLISWEEINHVPFASGGGQNGGWPHREGTIDPGLGRVCGLGNTFTDPAYAYPHGPVAAVFGGPTYRTAGTPESFPSGYDGRVFLGDFFQGWIRCLELDGGTWDVADPVPGQPSATDWGQSFLYYVDFQLGQDGALYLMRLIPAVGRPSGLYRIVPSSPVAAPAVATETDGRVVPNPVRPGRAARIQWRGAAPAGARVRIVDASGRTVRQLTAGGRTAVLWDGTGPDGRETPAGAYFWTLEGAGAEPRRGRLVRLR